MFWSEATLIYTEIMLFNTLDIINAVDRILRYFVCVCLILIRLGIIGFKCGRFELSLWIGSLK